MLLKGRTGLPFLRLRFERGMLTGILHEAETAPDRFQPLQQCEAERIGVCGNIENLVPRLRGEKLQKVFQAYSGSTSLSDCLRPTSSLMFSRVLPIFF